MADITGPAEVGGVVDIVAKDFFRIRGDFSYIEILTVFIGWP